MIRYYRLFDLLNRRDMKKTDLLQVISAPTLAKLSKGKNIQTDNIDKICLFLKCQPSDIMEVIDTVEEIDKNTLLMTKNEIEPTSQGTDSYTEVYGEVRQNGTTIAQADEQQKVNRSYLGTDK